MKLVFTPNLGHQCQVVRADGLPDVPLTLFANDLLKSLSPSSVPIYMREVLAAFDWAQSDDIVLRNRWSLFGPPSEVRNVLREYLTVAAKVQVDHQGRPPGCEGHVCLSDPRDGNQHPYSARRASALLRSSDIERRLRARESIAPRTNGPDQD